VRYLISAGLVIAAIIHLIPISGVRGAEKLTALYGIPFDDPNLVILMRHRAVLFGLLGAFLLVAALKPELQVSAFVAGFVSVLSFMWLAWSAGSYNASISRIFLGDVIALVGLVIGLAAYLYEHRRG
jgi:heme A synthase